MVRVGKASTVSQGLWDYTLDAAAIENDPDAKKAMEEVSKAIANLQKSSLNGKKGGSRSKLDISSERNKRDLTTTAVKASIDVRMNSFFLSNIN